MGRICFLAVALITICLAVITLYLPISKGQRAQSQKVELYVQTGHSMFISRVAFSPDGGILASGSGDKTIKLWSVETGQELRTLTGHTNAVIAVMFSPDGKTIASGSFDTTIKLWNVETGQELGTLTGHAEAVYAVAFWPDSKTLASGDMGGTIKLWNVETGRELRTLTPPRTDNDSDRRTVTFSPDGKTLAWGSQDNGMTRLLNLETGKELRTFSALSGDFAFSPDGKTIASEGLGKTIKLWDVETGQELRTLAGHADSIWSLAFSSDSKTLASTGSGKVMDTTIKLWSVETGRELKTLTLPRTDDDNAPSLTFSTDGKTLASVSLDDPIKLWNIETGRVVRTLSGQSVDVTLVIFSPDSKTIASGSDRTVKLWNVETSQEVKTLSGIGSPLRLFDFSPDSKTLVTLYHGDNRIKLWNVETGQELRTLAGHADSVWSLAFSPDSKTLASVSLDETIKLWNVETGRVLRTLTVPFGSDMSLAFSPDNKTLASGGPGGTIKLWNVETGRELRTLSGQSGKVISFAFSPDSKTLASGSYSATESFANTIKLWKVETGQELRTLSGHTDGIDSVAFSPDGKTLASWSLALTTDVKIYLSGSWDGTIKLWNVETGQELKSIKTTDLREVHSLIPNYADLDLGLPNQAIARDGRFHIKVGDNSKLDLYETTTGKLLASLVAFGDTDWAVVAPDGLFDGSPAAWKLLSWRLSERLYDIVPVEAFYNEFYRPNLLQDLFAGRTIERPTRDISTIDIRQPDVKLSLSGATHSTAPVTARQVTVTVEIKDAPADARRPKTSGAKDVRLFRNGSLVKIWRGNVLEGKGSVTLTATVSIVAGDNNFTAYAFNNENVKSRDGELRVTGADSLKRKGTAHILAIGINEYANPQYNLRYAVADARAFTEEIKNQQGKLGEYERVEITTLFDGEATKPNILRALEQLPAKIQPEDVVFVYFAGHGTAQQNRFYLIPHDLGYVGSRTAINKAGLVKMLAHSISDRELEDAFEKVDAGQILFVIDACNSGQALEAEERRRGPMNSKGLAQLAYEKGMYILTASQSFQAAQEASQLGHGLLTYALVEEGLKQAKSDREPKDGTILVREWLDYATNRVPEMQVDKMKALRNLFFVEEERGLNLNQDKRSGQRPRVFYRRELEADPLVVAKP